MTAEYNDQACKTPVQDLLRAIPKDLVIQYETDNNGFKVWHNCPIGREAHEAADTLAAQQAEIAGLYDSLHAAHGKVVDAENSSAALRKEVEALRGLLQVAACPANCIGGAYHGPHGEPVQCQFCYERDMLAPPTKEQPKC